MSDNHPYAKTQGIQSSASAPGALARAIQNASPAHQAVAKRAMAVASDGDHDHMDGHDGGEHAHEHVESRLTDHEGRIANLEGQHGSHGDEST